MHVTFESIVQYATLGTLLSGLVSLAVTRSFGPFPRDCGLGLTPVSRYPNATTTSQRSFFSTSRCWSLRMFSTSGDILRTIYGPFLRAEHQRTGANPLFEREWNLVKKQFGMYPNFIVYVDYLLPTRRPELSDRQEVILKVIGPH